MHPVGGTVFCYYPLAKALKDHFSLYGFEDPAIHSGKLQYHSIQDIAAAYLIALKKTQPEGPYLLGGASLGGLIAIEMAYQLQQQGETKINILLLDTWALQNDRITNKERLQQAMKRQYLLMKSKLLDENIPNPEPWFRIHAHRMELAAKYQPPQCDVPVFLFKANELMSEYQAYDDPKNYWAQYCKQLITMTVPGNHETLLIPPNVNYLSEKILKILSSHILPIA